MLDGTLKNAFALQGLRQPCVSNHIPQGKRAS